ncbi:PadR family transcriptional regulator [Paenibacillus rigui]|uniref:Transcription regulator PadR N-terminal domain-containing protein n=1 Tax=Paenibacillus rigui TaxID=554312 RepID=A0A229UUB3_9BACL|nr:PadR family transcriptional regulator [Paenibacillus rigui]OXM86499.1 hypothetical protein CF651_10020 [Paenibacillus rigui]
MQLQAKYVILGLLYKSPMSGYEIKKRFEEHFSFFFDASYGSVYPSLAKLEQEQCIMKRTIVQEGRPTKHEYEITPQGREQFNGYLESPMGMDSTRSDLCMRLYFGEFADDASIIRWLESGLQVNKSQSETLERLLSQYASKMSVPQQICVSIGIEHHQARYASIQKGLEQIREAGKLRKEDSL